MSEEEIEMTEEMTMVELPEEEVSDVEDTEDGGAIILMESVTVTEGSDHFANIVEEVDKSLLTTSISDLMTKIERDKEARQKRDKQFSGMYESRWRWRKQVS